MDKNNAPNIPRIDVHVHLISAREDRGAFIKPGAVHDPLLGALVDFRHKFAPWNNFLNRNFDDWYLRTLVKKIRRSQHVDKVVLLAFDAVYRPDGAADQENTQACTPNELVFEAAAAYPGELLPGVSIHPYRPDALEVLERYAAAGAVLVKWVPNSQLMDPADERIAPFYQKMAALGLPLLSHTGYEHALQAPEQAYGDPRRLAFPLDCGVTVIAAHAGSSGVDDPIEYFPFFIEMLDKYPRLYGDMAALTWINRKPYLMDLCGDRQRFFDRMVHGTDYPVPVWPRFFAKELGGGRTLAMTASRNYFDVEAELKLSVGMPASVLTRAASLLPIGDKKGKLQ
jgi:uncharacterized protein